MKKTYHRWQDVRPKTLAPQQLEAIDRAVEEGSVNFRAKQCITRLKLHSFAAYTSANVVMTTRIRPRWRARCHANDTTSFLRERARKKLRTSS